MGGSWVEALISTDNRVSGPRIVCIVSETTMPAMSSRDGPPHLLTLAPELIYAVCESVSTLPF